MNKEPHLIQPLLLRFPEAAQMLSLSESSLRRLVNRGDLKAIRLGIGPRGARGITIEELERFVAERMEDPSP